MVVLQVGAGHGVVATRETPGGDDAVRKLFRGGGGGAGGGGLTFGKWMGWGTSYRVGQGAPRLVPTRSPRGVHITLGIYHLCFLF